MGELSVAGLEQGGSVWTGAPMGEPSTAGLEQVDAVWMSWARVGLAKSRQARALGAHRWMAMDMLGVNRLCMAGPVSTELGVARLGVVGLAEERLVMAGRGAAGRKKSTRLVGAWTG